jgi:hypothetical protein
MSEQIDGCGTTDGEYIDIKPVKYKHITWRTYALVKRIAELEAQVGHPVLHLLALERTGWKRYVLGRWVYNSEPFRVDIQRSIKALEQGDE